MAFCVVASVTIAALMVHVLAWLRFEVRPEIERLFPQQRILVEPAGMDVVFLRLQSGSITEDVLMRLGNLEGVVAVHPQMAAEFPAMAEVKLPGMANAFSSEAAIFGVSTEMIAAELPSGSSFDPPPAGRPVPVMASAYFLDLYNLGIAESNRLPKITERAAVGREFDLILGDSMIGMGSRSRVRSVRARVVGLTRDPNLVGLIVPMQVLASWNREFASGWTPRFIRVLVDAESPDAALRVREQIKALGLSTTMAAEDLERYGQALAVAEWILGGLLAAILALAAVGVASTVAMSARERRASWGIQRAMGMKPGRLMLLVMGEGLLIAGTCSLIAAAILTAGAIALRNALGDTLETTAFFPGDPLTLGWPAYGSIVVLSILLVVLPLLLSAYAAARVEPVRLLAERSL
jgi:hypothetical protein